MKLIFADIYYDSTNYIEGKFETDLRENLLEFDKEIKTSPGDIGHDADWPVVLVDI